ncbi:MAG: glycoside hydrolase family 16 protein [Dactylosporangium sp.]|nr:glycoside hydrolase family 16 protein [Dactylosporangium sp.]NNJ63197.1 glycoside hydrolase family 16 protein [Dactylosporangium sp.]
MRTPVAETRDWLPVLANDFSGTTLPPSCSAYDGPPAGQAASYYRPDEVQVSGGMLRLSLRRRDFADRPYTAGGVGCKGLAQRYGRYEYRARIAPVPGIDSFVALLPQEDSGTDATLVEIFAETGRPGSPAMARISNASEEQSIRRDVRDSPVDGFHEYRIDWSPSGLRVLIDKEVAFVDSNASGKYRWLGFAMTTGGQESGLPNQDDLPTEFLIDWLRIYTYEPGSPALGPTTASSQSLGGSPARSNSQGMPARATTSGRSVSTVLVTVAAGLVVCVGLGFLSLALGLPDRLRRRRPAHRA